MAENKPPAKVCPMRLVASALDDTIKFGKKDILCMAGDCAWWNAAKGICGVVCQVV